MKEEGFSSTRIKADWYKNGITESNDSKTKGNHRFKRDGKSHFGVRIIRQVAEEIVGLSVQHITFEADPKAQSEKIRKIMIAVRALTEIRGDAEMRLIKEITEIDTDHLDKYLDILVTGGKLMRISRTSYKSVYT